MAIAYESTPYWLSPCYAYSTCAWFHWLLACVGIFFLIVLYLNFVFIHKQDQGYVRSIAMVSFLTSPLDLFVSTWFICLICFFACDIFLIFFKYVGMCKFVMYCIYLPVASDSSQLHAFWFLFPCLICYDMPVICLHIYWLQRSLWSLLTTALPFGSLKLSTMLCWLRSLFTISMEVSLLTWGLSIDAA